MSNCTKNIHSTSIPSSTNHFSSFSVHHKTKHKTNTIQIAQNFKNHSNTHIKNVISSLFIRTFSNWFKKS
nr:MAG TPA: hypothetical protein [Caudoviricetes sp.]